MHDITLVFPNATLTKCPWAASQVIVNGQFYFLQGISVGVQGFPIVLLPKWDLSRNN